MGNIEKGGVHLLVIRWGRVRRRLQCGGHGSDSGCSETLSRVLWVVACWSWSVQPQYSSPASTHLTTLTHRP